MDDSDKISSSPRLWLAAFSAALTALHFGYIITVINVPQQAFERCSIIQAQNGSATSSSLWGLKGCFSVSKTNYGLVGGAFALGGWIGGLFAGQLSRSQGLRNAILWLNLPLTMGYLSMALASSLTALVAGRLLQGLACGASGVIVPMYLAKIAPQHLRGPVTTCFQLFLVSGCLLGELFAYLFDVGRREWRWRATFGAGILVILLQCILAWVPFLNALPVLSTGRAEKAENRTSQTEESPSTAQPPIKLTTLNGSRLPADHKASDEEVVLASRATGSPTGDSALALVSGKIKRANQSLLLGILLHAGQQLSGVNAVFFYSASILAGKAEASNSESFLSPPSIVPIILTAVNVAMTLVAIGVLEMFGRRPVALTSTLGSAICMLLCAMSFSFFPSAAAVPLIAFVALFAVGLGPIPWMVLPEIFPSNWALTPLSISLCVSANWLVNTLVTGLFPMAADSPSIPKSLIFGFFAAALVSLFICLHSLQPETKGRPPAFI
jgi:sugar porter (SP) family MFS transporter